MHITAEEATLQGMSISPSLIQKINDMSEKIDIKSAESSQTLCEVQSLREMMKN